MGARMPSFFGYVAWLGAILIPIFRPRHGAVLRPWRAARRLPGGWGLRQPVPLR
ncbi:hypothetical protein ACJ4V0_13055 [Phreatobacter sp. HK31-P]